MILMNKAFQESLWIDAIKSLKIGERTNNLELINYFDCLLEYREGTFFFNYGKCQKIPALELTSFECTHNSFYLSDFFEDMNRSNMFHYLSQCCSEIVYRKEEMGVKAPIVFIVSAQFDDDLEIRLNFHIYRENDYYLDKNIDNYKEPVLIIIY